MKFRILTGAVLLTTAVAVAACSGTTPAASSSQSSSAASSTVTAASAATRTGTFGGLNDKHVAGSATVSGDSVVLSGFSSDEGPDLHIYLTNGTDEAAVAAGKQLSSVAFDKDSQTFPLAGVDPAKFTTVVIHCDKAKAVFGAATLS